MIDDLGPHQPSRGVLRLPRFAAKMEDSPHSVICGATSSTDDNHGRRSVSGDVCALGVDNQSQVYRIAFVIAAKQVFD